MTLEFNCWSCGAPMSAEKIGMYECSHCGSETVLTIPNQPLHFAAMNRSKTKTKQQTEADTINTVLDMCAESLDPELMGHVCDAVVDLCDARHIDQVLIRPWAK